MQSALPVLMYHHVSPMPGLVTVSPETFRAQIQALAERGWRSIGREEVEGFFAGKPLPDKSLLITFDDAYLDNLVFAHPVLAEFGMQALLFIVTSWVSDGAMRQGMQDCPDHNECKRRIRAGEADSVILRWSELEYLQAAGTFDCHAHTHTHTRWDQQGMDVSACCAALADDLALCRSVLDSRLGLVSRHLCWPQGYYHPDYVPVARSAGFDFLYTVNPTLNRLSGRREQIGRIVTRDQGGNWVSKRAALYASRWKTQCYHWLRGITT